MGASNGKAWQDLSVEELAVAVEGFGIAYKKYAAFVRANAVDGAMVVDCGGVESTLDMCEPPPNKLHRRKFLREVDANAQAVQAAKDAADKAAVEAALASNESASHAEKAARDEDMPASVREFVPLSSVVWIRSLATAMPLRKAELTIQRNPNDEAACAVAREAVKSLAAAIKHAAEARCNEPKIAAKFRSVINDGNRDFLAVYESVWSMIKNNDRVGLSQYVRAVRSVSFERGHGATQQVKDVVELLQHGAVAKPLFDDLVRRLSGSVEADVELSIPPTLKKVSRIVEKVQLDPTRPGDATRIFDVVRGMVTCKNLKDVSAVITAFAQSADITAVRAKERFLSNPSSGGWRDYMLCFYMNDDPNRHICELQVVHRNLLLARKGLPGHAIYNVVRNAAEMQEMLTACRTTFGWDEDRALEAGFNDSELVSAGFREAPEHPTEEQIDPREAYVAKAKALRDEYAVLKASGKMDDSLPGGGGSVAAERLAKLRERSALAKKAPEGPQPAALIDLFNATGGDTWKKTSSWTMKTPFKRWKQLKLDEQNNVVELKLNNINMSGRLPGAALAQLPHLENLTLYHNSLSGPIPTALCQLTKLRVLWLSKNRLSGPLPERLSALTSLQKLAVSSNQLNGCLTGSMIRGLTSLEHLDLDTNRFSGPIPSEIGLLTALRQLIMRVNQFCGQLPSEIGQLANVERIDFFGTQISGVVPSEIAQLSNLKKMNLGQKGTSCMSAGKVLKFQRMLLENAVPQAVHVQPRGLYCAPAIQHYQTHQPIQTRMRVAARESPTAAIASPAAQHQMVQVQVQVPAGISPGMPFFVQFNGRQLNVLCPANAHAGQTITVTIPP